MAWWGSAYARGLHINNPEMTVEQSQLASKAARKAVAALDDETPVEKALVRAVSKRYALPVPKDRSKLDQNYADAMEAAWHRFPDDGDVGALYAESLMNLQPWDLWTHNGTPKGRALEIVAVLERTIAKHPKHPGANHFYIHAIEASPWPEKGIPSAERLTNLVPGSGHLVHMPSHIFIRVGRYHDAVTANQRAIQADEAYFAKAPRPNFYSLYYIHNVHFLSYAAMMEGRYEVALKAARKIEKAIPAAFLKKYVTRADGFMPTSLYVMIRFGRWNDILREPAVDSSRLFSNAERHYSRAVAFANLGKLDDARHEIAALDKVAAKLTDEWKVGNNSAKTVIAVARTMALGEIAFKAGNAKQAFQLLRKAVAMEEKLTYDEPPGWMQPVRHALGALLLADGRAAEAETVYRADLVRHPNNAWSLLGLQQSLEAQGKTSAAKAIAARVRKAWSRSDIDPVASSRMNSQKRLQWIAALLIAVCFCCITGHSAIAAESTSRPNVLVILVDDLGYGDLSSYGAKDLKTPHIDALVNAGMKFTNFYANCPVCSPTRAALLTGRYQDMVGVPGVIRTHAENSWGYLHPDARLLPNLLKPAGYHSAIVGKWHLGLESPNTPNDRGFDFFHGYLGDMMDDYYNHRRHGINYMRKDRREIDPKGHATDLFTDWACEYLQSRKRHSDKPFFLYLAYNAPHTPIQPPDEWLVKVRKRQPNISLKRAKLVALIEHMDAGIGKVLKTLKETGADKNTLVVFTSDNGGQINVGANNGPLRDGKQSVYEGGLKVVDTTLKEPHDVTAPHPYGLLLIAGGQTHQENYARAFDADPRCRLVGLTDEPDIPARRRELNQELADELAIPVLDDLDAALARDDVQIVCVCTEPERRGRVAERCARAGKHIYVDKPLTTSVAAANGIVEAVAETGVKSQMFSLVRSTIAARARKITESGTLGRLVGLHCELCFAKGIAGTADLARPREEQATAEAFTFTESKRELFCVGLYPLVLFQWLTGKRYCNVSGSTANAFFSEHQRNDVEDFACMMLGMQEGIETTVTVGRTGWSSHRSHGVHQIHLIGTDGAATIDAFRPRLEIFSDAHGWSQPEVPHPEDPMGFWSSTQKSGGVEPKTDWWPIGPNLQSDASYFLDCIEYDRESDVPVSVGAHAVEAILAGYEAAATGRTIPLSS
eukprot:g26597.t1